MKKILLPLLTILLFNACQKQISIDKVSEEIAGASANKQTKFTVCHYDAVTGTSKSIEVTENALAGHLSHGDLQGDCSAVLTTICNQDWMIRNLDVDHYRNGDLIPEVTDPSEWAALTTGAWCYYNNDPAMGAIYGKLYNKYAVNDTRGLAVPTGWHIPTSAEWTTLSTCLGGDAIAGGKMKSTSGWYSDGNGSNLSGFTGLPSGIRQGYDGASLYVGMTGRWWHSNSLNLFCMLNWPENRLYFFFDGPANGFSVRCVRD